ncbi:MAG: hypothetical protein GWQ05_06750 [Verrucomicrobiaceae bacterium]|nr:hypothetical protein [Verrucomicrobiaceae bacterium]
MRLILCAVALTTTLLSYSVQAQGRLSRVVSTIIHNDETKTLSNRDFVKRTMEQQTYDIGGVLKMKRIFQLDRAGKVKSGLAFDGSGRPLFKFKYTYDELDRLDTEQVRDMKDSVVRVLKTVYDEQGKAHRIAKTDVDPTTIPKLHKEIFEHPELLEKKGTKLHGNQLNFKK